MRHKRSRDDEEFRRRFESFGISADQFNHEAHVRLAYAYLCENDPEEAAAAMKHALLAFLRHLGVGTARYHETITQAWIRAVSHFMETTSPCSSFAEFIAHNEVLLDSRIMLSHYSADVLFSDRARSKFVPPDLSPIPDHHE